MSSPTTLRVPRCSSPVLGSPKGGRVAHRTAPPPPSVWERANAREEGRRGGGALSWAEKGTLQSHPPPGPKPLPGLGRNLRKCAAQLRWGTGSQASPPEERRFFC